MSPQGVQALTCLMHCVCVRERKSFSLTHWKGDNLLTFHGLSPEMVPLSGSLSLKTYATDPVWFGTLQA